MSSTAPNSSTVPSAASKPGAAPGLPMQRVLTVDVLRGLVMVLLAAHGFGFAEVAAKLPNSRIWQLLGYEFSHVTWTGTTVWDLIQPGFMFVVGTAMAFSARSRVARGESSFAMWRHVLARALLLVVLGIFLRSTTAGHTVFTFKDVLTQIGLGYPFLFLLWNRTPRVQFLAATVILIGYWLAFVLYPLPPAGFDYTSVGVPADWSHFPGLAQHFDKNTNLAAAFDRWFLNLFPRPEPFVFDKVGYATLNFIPSLATMIFGLLTGELLISERTPREKVRLLFWAGVAAILVGRLLDLTGLCPIVKVIWTPSWTLFSTGWIVLLLALFYEVIDVRGYRRWCWPLMIVGMNSLLVYFLASLAPKWINQQLSTHFGDLFNVLGTTYAPLFEHLAPLVVLWLLCWWLYRQRIFIRI